MKVLLVVVVCILSFASISCHPNKRSLAFKSVKKCAKETGIDLVSVSKYFRGDFTVEATEKKCFLKCVANDLGFWINEKPQKESMMQFVDLLVKNTEGTSDIIDSCIAEDVSNDFCEHLHNVYKCFYSQAMSKTEIKPHHEDFHFDTVNENELESIKTD